MPSIKERIQTLCKKSQVTSKYLEETFGLGKGYISKIDKSVPNPSKIKPIADYFNVTVDYLIYGEQQEDGWYTNPETAKVAQEIFDDPDLHALFDAARDASPEALRSAAEMLRVLKHQYDSKE